MSTFDIVILQGVEPWHLLGLEAHLLDAVANSTTRPVLLIHTMRGRRLSVGRYHLYIPSPAAMAEPLASNRERSTDDHAEHVMSRVRAYRRFTGGRVVGAGEGWLGLALILPSRDALLPDHDIKLKPDQVMNRYVRGLLAGLRDLGLECFYPGRDAVTIERREIAMCTFETDASGAMLLECALAMNRGMEEVVQDLEDFDPAGQLPCAMYDPDAATKVVRELDRDVTFIEVATAIARGYSNLLGGGERRELTPLENAQAERRGASLEQRGWLSLSADGNLSGRIASQLGSIEARVKTSPDGIVENLDIIGDVIANSSGIAALRSEMSGRRLDLPSVSAAVMKVFSHGDNFILGIGDLANLVKLITRVQ